MSYKKFTKDIGIYGLTQLIIAVSGFVILPIITKILGAQNYGIWTQLTVTAGLVNSIAVLGLPYALLRFLAGEKSKEEVQDGIWSVFAVIFGVSSIISLPLILFSGPISNFFDCSEIFIFILVFIIIFECLNEVFYITFRVFQEIHKYSFFIVLQKLLELGLIILTVFLGYGLIGAILSLLIARIIIFLTSGALILKQIGIKIPKFLKIKEYLFFGFPTILGNTSSWIIQSSDRYLIGFFLGTLFVGYYNPAYAIGLFIINFLVAPFSFLLPAILAKFYDENNIDEVKIYLKYSLKYFLMLAIPAIFGLSILSKQLLTILTTPEFAEAGYIVMPIVALGMLPMGANAIIGQIVGITKKTHIGGILSIISALLNFVLNLVFIPKFGIIGAAVTTLIAFTFLFFSTWIYSFKHLQFNIDWLFMLKSILASFIMVLFIFWLNPAGLYKTMISIILGIAIYGTLIIILKSFSQHELLLFKETMKNPKT